MLSALVGAVVGFVFGDICCALRNKHQIETAEEALFREKLTVKARIIDARAEEREKLRTAHERRVKSLEAAVLKLTTRRT